jgi:4-hydroxybenzoate polyprenyltransferase
MICRLRLLIVMARPAVLLLLGLFTATGLAQTGRGEDRLLLAEALVVVLGFLLFSVAFNDLADEEIDRVNLPADPRRPLVAGTARRRELAVIGVTSGVVSLAGSAILGWRAVIVVAAGLALSACYSLRPPRLADRGAVASLLLPACYVAVPYLVGVFAGRSSLRGNDLTLLTGLYVGFIGRILLKDFRDLRGDAMFGKRTFLVRHGRRSTCAFSASGLVTGSVVLLAAVRQPSPALIAGYAAAVAATLGLLRALANDRGPRRDEALIAVVAIIGRGMLVALLAHLSMAYANWPVLASSAVVAALAVITAGQARSMLSRGPITRRTIASIPATVPTA